MLIGYMGSGMAFQVRRGTRADAAGAVETLHRSITELCVADHQGHMREIEAWLANKTVDAWAEWIARDDAIVLVASRDDRVVGVGMATLSGDILLNYVHPDARFAGVSKAILTALEGELRLHEVRHCRVETTITAQSFYKKCGFSPDVANALILSKPL
ncbi:GNAT superfamily N-acetyltransferase [Roseovarius sp. MBR-78]|uniref:GNAT family N-acetyltransferase n=1 Tax=Roseovarius sp. MBR-78 TaxID=3156460 RepID=UPI00339A357C